MKHLANASPRRDGYKGIGRRPKRPDGKQQIKNKHFIQANTTHQQINNCPDQAINSSLA
jgi:hypothetical protein